MIYFSIGKASLCSWYWYTTWTRSLEFFFHGWPDWSVQQPSGRGKERNLIGICVFKKLSYILCFNQQDAHDSIEDKLRASVSAAKVVSKVRRHWFGNVSRRNNTPTFLLFFLYTQEDADVIAIAISRSVADSISKRNVADNQEMETAIALSLVDQPLNLDRRHAEILHHDEIADIGDEKWFGYRTMNAFCTLLRQDFPHINGFYNLQWG